MKLIVGLGNPGKEYKNTRHNVGYMAIDAYASKANLSFKKKSVFNGEIAVGSGFILLKPTTYMNLSGDSVQKVAHYYHIELSDILVISDDFNIPFTTIRLREKGTAGGHNGIKSIISSLGSDEFPRLRIGLGSPENDVIEYVLSSISKEDLKKLDLLFDKTNSLIDRFIKGESIYSLQNSFNTNEPISWLFIKPFFN